MQALRALGARSLPVVARGDRFVFAQVIKDVVDFLGLDEVTTPALSPAALAQRYLHVLDTAVRLTRQVPDGHLEDCLPNRPRSWRVLMHHVFQIPLTFLDMEQNQDPFSYEKMVAGPPARLRTSADLAEFGEAVRKRFASWWRENAGTDFTIEVEPYFGKTSRHELFERTVWHSTQHVRQLTSLLEQVGVEPDRPLTHDDVQGLPLTDKIWDEA